MTISSLILTSNPSKPVSFSSEAQKLDFELSQNILLNIANDKTATEIQKKEWLISFLSNRWQFIKATEFDYTDCPQNPINQWCVTICNQLVAADNSLTASSMLMPSLQRGAGKLGDTSSLKELTEDVDGMFYPHHYLFVNEDSSRILNIEEFLQYAHANTSVAFKQFQMANDSECVYNELTDEHYQHLRHLTPELQELYDALFARHQQKFAGVSLGAALRDFTKAVKKSSTSEIGKELQADSKALAIRLQKMFDIYRALPTNIKQKLDQVKVGYYNKTIYKVLLTLVYGNPYCSKDMTAEEIRVVKQAEYLDCTDILNGDLSSLLNQSGNQWLFTVGMDGLPLQKKQNTGQVREIDFEKEITAVKQSLNKRSNSSAKQVINTTLLSSLLDLVKAQQPLSALNALNKALTEDYQKKANSIDRSLFKTPDRFQHRLDELKSNSFLSIFSPLMLICAMDPTLDQSILTAALNELIFDKRTKELNQIQLMRLLSLANKATQKFIVNAASDAIKNHMLKKENIDQMFNSLINYKTHEEQELLFSIFSPFVAEHLTEEHIQQLLDRMKNLSPVILQSLLARLAPVEEDEFEQIPDEWLQQPELTLEYLINQLEVAPNIDSKLKFIQNYQAAPKHQLLTVENVKLILLYMFSNANDVDMPAKYQALMLMLEESLLEVFTNLEKLIEFLEPYADNQALVSAALSISAKQVKLKPNFSLETLLAEHSACHIAAHATDNATTIALVGKHFRFVFEQHQAILLSQIKTTDQKSQLALLLDTDVDAMLDKQKPVSKMQRPIGSMFSLEQRYSKFVDNSVSDLENAKSVLKNYLRPCHQLSFFNYVPNGMMRLLSGHINRSSHHLVAVERALSTTDTASSISELVSNIVAEVINESNQTSNSLTPDSSLYRRLDYLMRCYNQQQSLEDIIHEQMSHQYTPTM